MIGGGQKAAGDKALQELLDMWVGFQRQPVKVRELSRVPSSPNPNPNPNPDPFNVSLSR